jgi:thioredoxin reductase (NADPH)
MISGRAALVTAQVRDPGRLLVVAPAELRRLVGERPETGERVLKAFLTRRTLLIDGGFQGIKIIGSRFDPHAHRLRDFASRNAIPFTWLDLEQDEQAETLLRQFGVPAAAMPVVIGRNGHFVERPSEAQMAECAGLDAPVDPEDLYDLVVVGAGPAGLAASVYAASEGLSVLTLDASAAGGQAGTSSRIENYLGFAAGVSGGELARQALLQAQKFGARILVPRPVRALRLDGGRRVLTFDDGGEVRARCVLVASGVAYGRLDLPNLAHYEGAGVYYSATEMEARLCRGEEVVVVGGGNSAGQAVVYLAKYARHVHLILRGADLGKSMSRYLVDRVEAMADVTVHRVCTVAALDGNGHVERLRLRYADGRERVIDAPALFLFIGAKPHTEWLRGCVELDRSGFVLTGDALRRGAPAIPRATGHRATFLETSLPGVFAAGDVRAGSVKRVASAVGEGSMAVSFVHGYIGATA